jgi:4-hydroxy-3-polyprenylbenzoate decarboxylase
MQSDPIFTKGPADVLDHATAEIALGMKLDIATPRKSTGAGGKHPWPPLIKMREDVHRKTYGVLNGEQVPNVLLAGDESSQ